MVTLGRAGRLVKGGRTRGPRVAGLCCLLALVAAANAEGELAPDACGQLAEKYGIVAGKSSGTAKPAVMTAWRMRGCEFWICEYYRQRYRISLGAPLPSNLPDGAREAWEHVRPAGSEHGEGDCGQILAMDKELTELLTPLSGDERGPDAATDAGKPCPPGCEDHGNCNAELGVCRCAVGYGGADCSQPLWPACKQHPAEEEMFCGNFAPKSCECLRQCYNTTCAKGPLYCDFHYDVRRARCFERPPGFSVEVDGVTWDGGSSLPEENEAGVQYYIGVPGLPPPAGDFKPEIVTRDRIIDMEPSAEDGILALPLRECPDRCSLRGVCVRRRRDSRPFCLCHYGAKGDRCEAADAGELGNRVCYNDCSGRGRCRRGFCHCEKGRWGQTCAFSKVYAPGSATPARHKLRAYVYDLPWEVAHRPEMAAGRNGADFIYSAWDVFAERFHRDTVVRTDNPWEANMFYIASMTFRYSSNLGDSVTHSRRAIDYVRQTWPFFNRTGGLDHFLWLTNDRGACSWPAGEEPHMANVMKVVHFGWHHDSERDGAPPPGWGEFRNRQWGCFHPQRDVVAPVFWENHAKWTGPTYGVPAGTPLFNPDDVPQRLLFFAGGIRANDPTYSFGVRQALHARFGGGQNPDIVILEGGTADYQAMIRSTKFCLAPAGHGWGIRLSQCMLLGSVPLIVQDGVHQASDDVLPYGNFSVTLALDDLPDIVRTLSAVSDADYRALKAGVAQHWRDFVWDEALGGRAYDNVLRSLDLRRQRLQARKIFPLREAL